MLVAVAPGASRADARRAAARASEEVLLHAVDDGFVQTLPQPGTQRVGKEGRKEAEEAFIRCDGTLWRS